MCTLQQLLFRVLQTAMTSSSILFLVMNKQAEEMVIRPSRLYTKMNGNLTTLMG